MEERTDDEGEPPLSLWLHGDIQFLDGRSCSAQSNPLIRKITGVASRRFFWEDALIAGPWVGLTLVEGVVFLSLLDLLPFGFWKQWVLVLLGFEVFLLPAVHGCLVGVASLSHAQAVMGRLPMKELVLTRLDPLMIVEGLSWRPLSVASFCVFTSSMLLFLCGVLGAVCAFAISDMDISLGANAFCSCLILCVALFFRILYFSALAEYGSAEGLWAALFERGSALWWAVAMRPLLLGVKWVTCIWLIPGVCVTIASLLVEQILYLLPFLVFVGVMAWMIALPLNAHLKGSWRRNAMVEAFARHEWGAGVVETSGTVSRRVPGGA